MTGKKTIKKPDRTKDRLLIFGTRLAWVIILSYSCCAIFLSFVFIWLIIKPNPDEFWIFFQFENLVGKLIFFVLFFVLGCYGIKISLDVKKFFKKLWGGNNNF